MNYNGKEYNHDCIESILKNQVDAEYSIMVIDNASTDGSMDELSREYATDKRVILHRFESNRGFAAANNVGIRAALQDHIDYIMLLNNDTVIAKDMLQRLLECADRHVNSVITPKIFCNTPENVIWAAGGSLSRFLKKPKQIGEGCIDQGQFDEENSITFATGCCVFFSYKVVERVGLMDETYFLYYEDTDWSIRTTKAGVEMYYCPEALMWHMVSGSTKGNKNPACSYYITRNFPQYIYKNVHSRYWVFILYFILNRGAWFFIWVLHGEKQHIYAMLCGIRDVVLGRRGKWDGA